jgi:hypothetical protein
MSILQYLLYYCFYTELKILSKPSVTSFSLSSLQEDAIFGDLLIWLYLYKMQLLLQIIISLYVFHPTSIEC